MGNGSVLALAIEVHNVETKLGLNNIGVANLAACVEDPVVECVNHIAIGNILIEYAGVVGVLLTQLLKGLLGLFAGKVGGKNVASFLFSLGKLFFGSRM